MTKKIVLTVFAALMTTILAWSQTDRTVSPSAEPSPANKTEKAAKAKSIKDANVTKRAEEKSEGAAFSGRGEGGDKDAVEKKEKGKGKKKGHYKDKKGKGKNKSKKIKSKKEGQDDPEAGEAGDRRTRAGDNGEPQPVERKIERKKEPQPTPSTPGGGRKPGDKPAPGTEKKDNRNRG